LTGEGESNLAVVIPGVVTPLILFAGFAIESVIKGTPGLTASKAFTSLSLLFLIIQPAQELLIVIARIFGLSGSVTRLQDFLSNDLKSEKPYSDETDPSAHGDIISADDVVLQYFKEEDVTTPIRFSLSPGSITVLLGPVGSGKSILLRTILGDLEPIKGKISIKASSIGYCSAKSWIQKCSVRQNITGPLEYHEGWYNEVVRVCDLQKDFSQLKDEDLSEAGASGSLLSGGQKHRIALARALYSKSPVLLLDDLFTSLDQKTRAFVIEALLGADGHAKKYNLTILLATHLSMISLSLNVDD
jgi:ATP-binding cassette subfamily C (CFTR/MRP) protein 1